MAVPHTIQRISFLVALGTAAVFGLWPVCVRSVYLDGGNAIFGLLITSWSRALPLAIFCLLTRKPLFATREHIKQALIGGFFQMVSPICLFMALERLPGPLVIIIFFTHTLMLLFYMAWRGEIKLDAVTVLTTLMALTGLSLVLDLWHQKSSAELWGIALAFGAAVTAVIRLYVYGHQVRTRHPVTVGAESFLIAAALMLCVLLFGKPVAPATLTGAGYAVLGCVAMALGTFGMFYGIMMLGSFRWSLYAKMEPVLTALFSALLIGEMLKPAQYGGMAVVLGSLILYQIVDGRKNAAVFDEEMG